MDGCTVTVTRNMVFQQFLSRNGWQDAGITRLAGDASTRRYLRLSREHDTAIVMDVPGKGDSVDPFLAMTEWLRSCGYSAPNVLATERTAGFLLLEDLGEDLYSVWLRRNPEDEETLYTRAVEVLVDIAARPPPRSIGSQPAQTPVPPYNDVALEREVLLMPQWWMRAALRGPVKEAATEVYLNLMRRALRDIAECRQVMVLRDYHADNLLWLPDRVGLASVGLLDYQDVVAGHPAYDLVSLLEDARRDTGADLREAMITHYLALRPEEDPQSFRRAYAVLGAQRNLKIIGIFARLAVRDRKPRYLQMIPRVWAHLQNDLEHPALEELRDWVAQNVPSPSDDVLASIMAEAAQ